MLTEVATIRDISMGASADILVSQGFNCFRFTAVPDGQPVDVLYAPADFGEGQGRPSRGGIPLMFPFPGRIPGTTFTWEGKTYSLPAGDALGNAIHGFVMWRPWAVIDRADNQIVGEFQAWEDDPALKAQWPADFRVRAIYTLLGNTLHGQYTIENPGDAPLPCGFGTHPYFRVPLGGASADDCVVRLPVSERWELKDMITTGRRDPVEGAATFQAGRRFGDLQFDDALSGLQFDGEWCTASIHDPGSGRTMSQRFNSAFRECVVYTPPHREAICIEPLSCAPNCFELAARGIDSGLRVIEPGGSFSAHVQISVT